MLTEAEIATYTDDSERVVREMARALQRVLAVRQRVCLTLKDSAGKPVFTDAE